LASPDSSLARELRDRANAATRARLNVFAKRTLIGAPEQFSAKVGARPPEADRTI
jgi:hypothetical protein